MAREKRPITPEDIYRLRNVSDAQISPDGKWVACVIAQADRRKDRSLSDIWLVATRGRRRVQLTNRFHRDGSPRWSPDGRSIAFLAPERDDDKAKAQIWVIPVGGGEAKQVTRMKQGVSSPVWSPDGSRIAFLARDPKREDEEGHEGKPKFEVKNGRVYATDVLATDRMRIRSGHVATKDSRRHIYVVSAQGGRPRRLTSGDCDNSDPAWSPDGRRIAYVSNRERDPDWDLMGDVWIVPTRGGRPRRLSTLAGGASAPAWSRDGRSIAYVGSTARELSFLEEKLWVQPIRGGEGVCLTRSLDRGPMSPRWALDGTGVYFTCLDEGFHSLWRAGLDGTVTRALPKERFVGGYSIAEETGDIAYTHSPAERPAEVFVRLGASGREKRLTNENGAALRRLAVGGVEAFWCRSSGGRRVQAWVVTPPGLRKGRKHPLVLVIHGGPYAAYSQSWRLDAQALAARGYVVVYANPCGSVGYGRAFTEALVAEFGIADSPDVLSAVGAVIRRGYVDRRRLGVMGGSYGGLLTTWLLGTTRRFRAGVAICPTTDHALQFYMSDMKSWREEQFGAPPWEKLEAYRRVSSSTHAHKIRAPLLFLHAEDDTRVPIANAEIVYTTLKRMGAESEFVRYPSGDHGFMGSAPRFTCDGLNRIIDWFDQHLRP